MKIIVTGGSGFIGTNLVQQLLSLGHEVTNIDIARPKLNEHLSHWKKCDILNESELTMLVKEIGAEVIVHLAAETDTNPDWTLDNYRANTDGTLNVLTAIKSSGSLNHVIITSTQYVNQSPEGPKNDFDYAPHTIYGESKIITEKYTREADLTCTWTIIRPTNVWGPWHLRYPFEFWKVLSEGKYFHPGRKRVIRSYGYVGNIVGQILTIIESPHETVNERVFYVGDRPIDLYDWVNGFSLAQTGKKVRVLPRFFVYLLAVFGSLLRKVKVKFPITLSRYRSMTTDNPVNIEKTFEILGNPKYTLQQGIDETVKWMRAVHPNLIRTK